MADIQAEVCFDGAMKNAPLRNLVAWCDRILGPEKFNDWPGAMNGLQVENSGRVVKIAAAVDASLATVNLAIREGANLLLVHHGLFWSPSAPWTGKKYALIKALLDHDVAVYSSHLPLDAHPTLGNNARLAAELGFKKTEPFFFEKGQNLGLRAKTNLALPDLAALLGKAVGGKVTVLPGGPSQCRRVGIVTGGAGQQLKTAAAEGVDTFITGEGPHWTYALAEELGVNVLYAGHYATETFGVKALAALMAERFGLPWTFLDYPTGL